jgi:hypothetical protein
MMVASAFARATLAPVSAFVFSTLPSSHVPAKLAIGPISAVNISTSSAPVLGGYSDSLQPLETSSFVQQNAHKMTCVV